MYYGRDPVGRRSLLHGQDSRDALFICSVASQEWIQQGAQLTEVSCDAIWRVNFAQLAVSTPIPRRQKVRLPVYTNLFDTRLECNTAHPVRATCTYTRRSCAIARF